MKLDSLKLKAEEIFFLQEYLQPIHDITLANFTRLGQEEKLKYSVMFDVSKTVTNKRRLIEQRSTIFDSKKRYQVTLKYHEVFLLLNFIQSLEINDTHSEMLQRNLVAILDFALQ